MCDIHRMNYEKNSMEVATREGGMTALDRNDALEQLEEMAEKVWKAPLLKTQIFVVNEDGELGERVAVITHTPVKGSGPTPLALPSPPTSPVPERGQSELYTHGTVFVPTTHFNTMMPREK